MLRQAETILVEDELPIVPLFFYKGIHFWHADEIEGIYFDKNILDEHPLYAIGRKKPKQVSQK